MQSFAMFPITIARWQSVLAQSIMGKFSENQMALSMCCLVKVLGNEHDIPSNAVL